MRRRSPPVSTPSSAEPDQTPFLGGIWHAARRDGLVVALCAFMATSAACHTYFEAPIVLCVALMIVSTVAVTGVKIYEKYTEYKIVEKKTDAIFEREAPPLIEKLVKRAERVNKSDSKGSS